MTAIPKRRWFRFSLRTLFRNMALGAFVGFILVTASLIAANVVAMIQLF